MATDVKDWSELDTRLRYLRKSLRILLLLGFLTVLDILKAPIRFTEVEEGNLAPLLLDFSRTSRLSVDLGKTTLSGPYGHAGRGGRP